MRDTLSLFAGRPDAGKSTAARYFGAGYTRGTIPGCFHGQCQNVAYIAAEESLEVMVKPSLRAHGADLDRVHFPKVEMDGQQVRLLSNVDEAALTADFRARGITVVIVDPVMSAISSAARHLPQQRNPRIPRTVGADGRRDQRTRHRNCAPDQSSQR